MKSEQRLARSGEVSEKVGRLLSHRIGVARERYGERLAGVFDDLTHAWTGSQPATPWVGLDAWKTWADYTVDFGQRSILFWDTLRRRGNDYLERAAFFEVYGKLFALDLAGRPAGEPEETPKVDARELPFVKQALATRAEGGYPEAVARVAFLLAHRGEPLPLSKLQLKQELIEEYRDLLPDTTPDQQRRIRGEQEIIVLFEPEAAVESLSQLLADPADRERLLTLLERILTDERVTQRIHPTPEQTAMLERIRRVLSGQNLSGQNQARPLARGRGGRKS